MKRLKKHTEFVPHVKKKPKQGLKRFVFKPVRVLRLTSYKKADFMTSEKKTDKKRQRSDFMTIQRHPDDPRSPYVMIHRDIINDRSISPKTRWFVIYCDSLENNFHLSETELVENTGLEIEEIRSMIEEAIAAGLMVRKKEMNNE